jgi:predicted PurR-regulated permease PerM
MPMELEQGQSELPPSSAGLPDSRRKVRKRHWAMNLIGLGVILGLCYYAELVLVVVLLSALLAFILAPLVELLILLHLPRAVAAFISVFLLCAALTGIAYVSLHQTLTFVAVLPQYTDRIRDEVIKIRNQAEDLDVLDSKDDKTVLKVRPTEDFGAAFSRRFGSVSEALLSLTFVPFLVYFMLSWQHHVRSATVMLFPLENRHTAYVTLGLISAMIRSFMVGNVLIGLLLAMASTAAFAALHLPFFYLAGVLSGFLSLVPYMGIPLAILPPLFVGIGQVSSSDLATITLIVTLLHVIALNALYPKFLGNRLKINPLAVTLSLLFWGWLWGAVGLLLAIPLTAATKIVFDHIETLKPYGAWLGE